jgi:hypothetical protein
MPWIERHHFRVAVGTEWNAVLERIGAAISFGKNVVALKSCVLSLMTQAAVSLAGNKGLQMHIERKRHVGLGLTSQIADAAPVTPRSE